MSNANINSVIQSLQQFSHAKLSPYPENVYGEVKGKILEYQVFDTISGDCLLLVLEIGGEIKTFVVSDIVGIELNDSFNHSEFRKFYFYRKNIAIVDSLSLLEQSKELGASYDKDEYLKLKNQETLTQRIELTNH
ncbi:hypothetical protein C1I60_12890 [Paenibacillus terrae]|uniref:Uncharacterized protein n=1 Tax=Paenibacillus terrae TaxID=159743 RepID=A0A4V5SQ52_9BACL|nr:hypothetical protein [Paenibacillus terrae]TKH44221.1 hypothetical protein C1I60_12890 [Paenibacillus terrae]